MAHVNEMAWRHLLDEGSARKILFCFVFRLTGCIAYAQRRHSVDVHVDNTVLLRIRFKQNMQSKQAVDRLAMQIG